MKVQTCGHTWDVFLRFLTDSTIEGDDVSICSVRAEERGSGYRGKDARIYVQLQLQSTSSQKFKTSPEEQTIDLTNKDMTMDSQRFSRWFHSAWRTTGAIL